MIAKCHLSNVKSRTMCCIAFFLALARPDAIRAQSQCYIDPVTGQRLVRVVRRRAATAS